MYTILLCVVVSVLLKTLEVGIKTLSEFLRIRNKTRSQYSSDFRCQYQSSETTPEEFPQYITKPVSNLSYLSVPGSVPLLDLTIGKLVEQSAQLFPDFPAIVVSTPPIVRKSYKDLNAEVNQLAAGLLTLGLENRDRIGIWGPNSYEWYLTYLAATKCGLVAVNINPAYQARELEYCMNKVGVKCMIIADQFKTCNYYAMMLQVCPEIQSSDPGKIESKGSPTLTTLITMSSTPMKGAYTLSQVLQKGSTTEAVAELEKAAGEVQFDDLCNIQFSSGTTGAPKGIMLSHHNMVNTAYFVARRLGYSPNDKICLPVPLFYSFGGIMGGLAALHSGAALVLPSPRFSPTSTLKAIATEGCTAIYGTPTMHIGLCHAPDLHQYDLRSLRHAVIGGAPCPEQLVRMTKEKYGVESITAAYGLTETSTAAFLSLPTDNSKMVADSVGYPMEHLEVKIVDTDGKVVQVGDEGEMCIRGYSVMQGYWQDGEAKTSEAIDTSRWFHTGDLAVMLESGHARIVARLKDVIIRGGENIYPREIEDFLHSHPDIMEAHVFPVPDFKMGEEVCAWVKLHHHGGATQMSPAELRAFCKGKIAHYKIPKHVKFVDDFPKTCSGKIPKFKMSEMMSKELGILEQGQPSSMG